MLHNSVVGRDKVESRTLSYVHLGKTPSAIFLSQCGCFKKGFHLDKSPCVVLPGLAFAKQHLDVYLLNFEEIFLKALSS